MAEVYGIIGNEQVELNNAATESTLKQLLAAVMMGSKQSLDNVNKMAQKLGLDPTKVQETNTGLSSLGKGAQTLGAGYAGLSVATGQLSSAFRGIQGITQEFTSGAGQASSILTTFSRIGGPLGAIVSGMTMLATFQETQLDSYRSLTQAGINFGGSLTDLRTAAANTYMTMDQFAKFGKENSEFLGRLGTTADEGTKAFVRVSKEFNSSQIGNQLRALGLTSEQMNVELVKFMSLQGKAGVQDVKRVQETQAATASYLFELDSLTKLTGANKDKLEQEQKKAEMNAAFQAKLLSLAPAEQAKLKAAYDKAAASGIKGATDLVMSTALGIAPVTKESQVLAGVLPEAAQGFTNMTNSAMQTGTTMRDVNRQYAGAIEGAISGTKGLEQTIGALSMSGSEYGSVLNSGLAASNEAQLKQQDSVDKYMAAYDKAASQQITQQNSQADAAVRVETAMKELGQSIMARLMPMVESLLPALNSFLNGMLSVVEWFIKTPAALSTLASVTGVVVAGFTALKVAQAVATARELARTGGRKLGTPGAPMIVKDVGGGFGDTSAGGKGGFGGKLLKGAAGFGIGTLVGVGADFAADALGRETAAGASADVLGTAASMAGTGAMVGSVIPGLGTAIGAGIGGLAGGAYGLYQNWGTIFGGGAKPIPKPAMPEKSAVEAEISEKALSLPGITIADPMEKMAAQLERLNTQTLEMIRYLRETAEQARRNVDATRSLNGNLFPTP